jgi:hypothetical protein
MKRLSVCLVLLVASCSEQRIDALVIADTGVDVPAALAPVDVGTTSTTDAGATVATDAGATVATGALVINEIRAVGEEWVELFNAGAAPVDLSDVMVTDTETDDGGPRVSRAMRFPRGTMLSPGQHVVIVSDQADAGSGPQTRCPDGGPATCFHAGWSLSASRGESVWVLSPAGAVTTRELYPMEAAPEGQSWGRVPDGTGPFGATRPTPGAANARP